MIPEEKIFFKNRSAVVSEEQKKHLHDVMFYFCHVRSVFSTGCSTTSDWKGNSDISL